MKLSVEVTKKRVLLTVLMLTVLAISNLYSLGAGYSRGYGKGYDEALEDIVNLVGEKYGIQLEIVRQPDGSYLLYSPGLSLPLRLELHMTVAHYRNGVLLSKTYHAMSLTTFGKNWICDNLAKVGGDNVSKSATYIALSNDSSAVSAAWTCLPNEITTDGLSRANGSFTDTGIGTWNMTKSFSVTGDNSTKLYGLHIDSYANWPNGGLIAAEQQGVGNQKNVENGDTLQVTVQGTIS